MTLKTCLEIGKDCGLETVGECILNIRMHSINIFKYEDINKELKQLYGEANDLFESTTFTKYSKIEYVLSVI